MKITFLGTSHGITEKDRYTSSTLIEAGGKYYLVDAGAPIMKLLQEVDVPFTSLGDIFITHSHGDHYMGLVEFTNQIESFGQFDGVKVMIHAPELFPYDAMRTFLFGDHFDIRKLGGSRKDGAEEANRVLCEKYSEGKIFDDGNITVTAYKTRHYQDSHSLLIEGEGKRILFTGDLRHDFLDFPYDACKEGLDLVVMEGAHSLINSDVAIETFRKIKTKRMIINHIYTVRNTYEMVGEAAERLADLYPITVAEDGDAIEL